VAGVNPWHVRIPWRWFLWGDGFTLGPFIFIRPNHSEGLYAHELVHVRQFWDDPFLFWIKYLYYLIRYGYQDNPYEREAYAAQKKAASSGGGD